MTPWERWKKVSINNKLMIYMTAILAVATTLYTLMYRSQVKFMEESSRQSAEQTTRLIAASERSANAATRFADTATEQARSAKESAEAAKKSASAAQETVNQTKRLVDATLSQSEATLRQTEANILSTKASITQMKLAMIPRLEASFEVVPFEADKQAKVEIKLMNKGSSIALNLIAEGHIVRFDPPLSDSWRPYAVGPPSVADLAPQGSIYIPIVTRESLSADELQRIINGKRQLRVWLWGTYNTEFGDRDQPFLFCWAYDSRLNRLANCSKEQRAEHKPN